MYNVCEILQVVVGILDPKLRILLQLLCCFSLLLQFLNWPVWF